MTACDHVDASVAPTRAIERGASSEVRSAATRHSIAPELKSMSDAPTKPRISPLPHEGEDPPLNIFRTLAHNEDLFKAFGKLGSYLLRHGVLPAREREIVILRVGWRCGCEYEFGQHTVIGRTSGLTDEEIARLAGSDSSGWEPADAVLIDMADELCESNLVSEATWNSMRERWSEADTLELLVLAGYYRLVSGMLNSVGVALEPATPGWPPTAIPSRRSPRDKRS